MVNYAQLQILTTDSVDRLRSEATGSGASRVWNSDLAGLADVFELKFVESQYSVNLDQGLLQPTDGVPNRELDAENSLRALDALPSLTPADATDERLWVTLALGAYRDYLLARWPKDTEDLGNHLVNHVFASTARGRERDHAVARLWWSGYYVRRFATDDPRATLRTFFLNSQLSVDLLGRPNLATVGPFARSALKLFGKYYVDRGVPFDRRSFQDFFKGIDFVAGRNAIGSLEDHEVESLLEERFREHLGLKATDVDVQAT